MSKLTPPPSAPDNAQLDVRRHAISAAVLVVGSAIIFASIGLFRSEGPVSAEVTAAPVASISAPEQSIDPVDGASDTPSPDASSSEQSTAPSEEPAAEPASAQDVSRIAPASISVQILDAVLEDGKKAANQVRDDLQAKGYRIAANNSAIRTYQKTTVMYSAGFEAQASQIAKEFGFTEVQLKPDNLTDSVQIHVVVGLDAK
ncbi:MAG: hypothetical protein ACI867_000124 [Glaciecola sp.]|jgi:hypothetical protein